MCSHVLVIGASISMVGYESLIETQYKKILLQQHSVKGLSPNEYNIGGPTVLVAKTFSDFLVHNEAILECKAGRLSMRCAEVPIYHG